MPVGLSGLEPLTSALSGMLSLRDGRERPRMTVQDCPREYTYGQMRCYSL